MVLKYRIRFLFYIYLYFSNSIFASPYYVCETGYDRGLFSCMMTVIGFLHFLEENNANGEVLLNQGPYLSHEHGSNWWDYFFEPIRMEKPANAQIIYCSQGQLCLMSLDVAKKLSRSRVYELYHRYVKVLPNLQLKIDDFYNKYFKSNYVIGVHYRGTDKQLKEASKIGYQQAIDLIMNQVNALSKEKMAKLVIFIATDDQMFLDFAIQRLPNVIFQSDIERSKDTEPIHLKSQDPYNQGLSSVIDFVLLSKTDFLIRTDSNLSLMSYLINLELESIKINHSLWGARSIF